MRRSTTYRAAIAAAALLAIALDASAQSYDYPWQDPKAKVIATGDLEWQPEAFVFEAGEDPRYIDFDGGNDDADGTSRETAWKHHPWDRRAESNAAAAEGARTYVFKGGVVYRGRLDADESGTSPDERIVLTSDPTWGEGQGVLSGAIEIADGWAKLDPDAAPTGLPDAADVWMIDARSLVGRDDFVARKLWKAGTDATAGEPMRMARWPDWTGEEDPHDIKAGWHTWTAAETRKELAGTDTQYSAGTDAEHLPKGDEDFADGAYVYSEWGPVMGTPAALRVEAYDADTQTIYMGGFFGGTTQNMLPANARYYLENNPHYLDTPGEFWFSESGDDAGTLYLKVQPGEDPNEEAYDLGVERILVELPGGTEHVEIANLAFRHTTVWPELEARWYVAPEVECAAIHLLDDGNDLVVRNNTFEHVAAAVFFRAALDGSFLDNVLVSDNEIRHTDHGAIMIKNGSAWSKVDDSMGKLGRVDVLRNKLYSIGERPLRGGHGHAIEILYPETSEIAGNVLDKTYAAGVYFFGGKGSGHEWDAPFSRHLIHHNKVTNSLVYCNDWGGIESWQGGPTYIYNNVSGNPGGYWHWNHVNRPNLDARGHTTARFAFAYYLDAGFKNYLFNNIAFGNEDGSDLSSPHANTAALQGIIGYLNVAFNNTFYNFASGVRQQGPVAGRMKYLGNVMAEIGDTYFRNADQDRNADANQADARNEKDDAYAYETLAYARNVFHGGDGKPRTFGVFERTFGPYESLDDFSEALQKYGPLASGVGVEASDMPLRDPAAGDFRLSDDSAAVDAGVKAFVPWSLYKTVGEWNFTPQPSDPTRVQGENWYLYEAYRERHNYYHLPPVDLVAEGATADHWVDGELEDWTRGALAFDGEITAKVSQADVAAQVEYREGSEDRVVAPADRPTLDPIGDNLIVELFFKADVDAGSLVAKGEGYALNLDDGRVSFSVAGSSVTSEAGVADGEWHHVLAELNREAGELRLYVDGKQDAARRFDFDADSEIRNDADFVVGEGFVGAIDFLRVARGSLADSKTSIGELYAWQFDGPFLRDFAGNAPAGAGRDAGALESVPVSASR